MAVVAAVAPAEAVGPVVVAAAPAASVWIEHSLSFRGREQLFLSDERWNSEARRHYARLQLPAKASEFLAPLLERVRAGVEAVAAAARSGDLRVDDELHLAALAADDEDPEVTRLRAQLDQRIGEVQLPEANRSIGLALNDLRTSLSKLKPPSNVAGKYEDWVTDIS